MDINKKKWKNFRNIIFIGDIARDLNKNIFWWRRYVGR